MGLEHLLVAGVGLVNLFASLAVVRVPVFSRSQRLLQLALIWLVPILGAIVCTVFAYAQAAGAPSAGTMDPSYLPLDGGGPDAPGFGSGGCSGGDGGCGGGGEGGD